MSQFPYFSNPNINTNDMNLTRTSIFFCLLIISVTSCSKKQSTEQPAAQSFDVSDLKDFPKEWVMAEDTGADSLKQTFVIPVDSANAIVGTITIVQNGSEWQMINKGFYAPGTYTIKNFKLANDGGQLVFYDVLLQSTQDTTTVKLSINFNQVTGDEIVASPFTCLTCYDYPKVQMIEKPIAARVPKKPMSELQYD
jgi:hypothetical protein